MKIADMYAEDPDGPSATNLSKRLERLARYICRNFQSEPSLAALAVTLVNFTARSPASWIAAVLQRLHSLALISAILKRPVLLYPRFSKSLMCAKSFTGRATVPDFCIV